MILPGHGTVLYNKEHVHLVCAAATGVIEFELSSEDTNIPAGTYNFDVQIYNSSTKKTHTVAYGDFIVTQDITIEV